MPVVIRSKEISDDRISLFHSQCANRYRVSILKAHKCTIGQQIIKRPDYFYIGIHINAAILLKDYKPCHVCHKSPFFCFINFSAIVILMDVEIRLIPLLDIIIRAVLRPRFHALYYAIWLFFSTKPAVMDNLGNHSNLPYLY